MPPGRDAPARARPSAPVVALVVTLVVVAVSALASWLVVPELIARAYRGDASVLNALIRGRALHSLDHYLDAWRRLAPALVVLEAVLGGVTAAVLWSRPALSRLTGLSGRRVLTIHLVFLVFAGTQVLEAAGQSEHWPFSNYGMYSAVQAPVISWVRLAGVTDDGEFWLDEVHLRPFTRDRISLILLGLMPKQAAWSARMDEALAGIGRLYVDGSRSGRHGGPPLRALRLYRLGWTLDASLANRAVPDSKELLGEHRLR
jgi:hypothetical protein